MRSARDKLQGAGAIRCRVEANGLCVEVRSGGCDFNGAIPCGVIRQAAATKSDRKSVDIGVRNPR